MTGAEIGSRRATPRSADPGPMTPIPIALPCEDAVKPRLREGAIVGSYRVFSPLGAGTTCEVYLAEHETLGRRVALKMLRPAFSNNRTLVHRFVREARAVNKIRHKHVVQITDLGDHPAGPFFIMELLDGASLEAVISREAPFSTERCLAIATQIASAMEAAHAADIIHRDLKPENIFLVAHEEPDFVKVLDFGIAKVIEAVAVTDTDTAPGTILGSPAYMSPEQVQGRELDQRTDIYSLGVVLYEMLSGQRPFTGDTLQEVLTGQACRAPRPLSELQLCDLDVALDALVMHCMAKPPDSRPGSMAEVRQQLDQIAERRAAPAIASQPVIEGEPEETDPVQLEKSEPPNGATFDALTIPSDRQWTYTLAVVVTLCIGVLSLLLRGDELVQASAAQPHVPKVQRPSAAGPFSSAPAPQGDPGSPAAPGRAASQAPVPQGAPGSPAAPGRAASQAAGFRRAVTASASASATARLDAPRPRPAREPRAAARPRQPRKLGRQRITLSTTINPFEAH